MIFNNDYADEYIPTEEEREYQDYLESTYLEMQYDMINEES